MLDPSKESDCEKFICSVKQEKINRPDESEEDIADKMLFTLYQQQQENRRARRDQFKAGSIRVEDFIDESCSLNVVIAM